MYTQQDQCFKNSIGMLITAVQISAHHITATSHRVHTRTNSCVQKQYYTYIYTGAGVLLPCSSSNVINQKSLETNTTSAYMNSCRICNIRGALCYIYARACVCTCVYTSRIVQMPEWLARSLVGLDSFLIHELTTKVSFLYRVVGCGVFGPTSLLGTSNPPAL